MLRSKLRTLLIPLSVTVLAVGLAPPPAAASHWPAWPASAPLVPQATSTAGGTLSAPAVPPGTAEASTTQPGDPVPAIASLATQGEIAPPATTTLDLLADFDGGREFGAPETGADPESGVADEVRQAVAADGEAAVLIRLVEQVDPAAVTRAADHVAQVTAAGLLDVTGSGPTLGEAVRTARVAEVVRHLRTTAERSQPEVHQLLQDHQATDVTPYWVVNGVAATVDAEALDALAAHPAVASVTLDTEIVLDLPTLTEVGEPRLPAWSLDQINAPTVWGEYGTRGAGVVVGVIDTGVDFTHPALAAAWRGNDGDLDASWHVSTGENYPVPGDGSGHGTHVAGSILGAPPGEVIGVAPQARWIASKGLNDAGNGSASGLLASFEWMLAPGGDPANAPHVVNNSWGSPGQPNSTVFWEAVEMWVAAGIVPVFANGNDGPGDSTASAPGSFPHTIGVGATDEHDRLAWFSSRGPIVWDGVPHQKPQVSAPGWQVLSSLPGGGYGLASGTSMAAPHVTGVVALMLSANPTLTIDQIRTGLEVTARSAPHMAALPEGYGAGVVDAHAAVTWAAHSGDVTGTISGSVTSTNGNPIEATVSVAGFSTVSDPETGHYTIRVPAGTHQLTGSQYAFRSRTQQITVGVGQQVALDLALDPAPLRSLTGTVTGPDGPVVDARVLIAGAPVAPVRSDADGRFALTVAEGDYRLHVDAAGHAPTSLPLQITGDTDRPVTLTAAAIARQPGWSQYLNNPGRTGQADEPLFPEALEPQWTSQAGGTVLFSSPVIADGRAFITTENGLLSAFDLADGQRLWQAPGSTGRRGAPAVADGIVVAGGGLDGGFFAYDAATGELVWQVPTPGRRTALSTPAVVDGVVYAATGSTSDSPDTVFAIDLDSGQVLWATDIGPRMLLGPAVADGLVVAASSGTRTVVALDAATGAQVWSFTHPGSNEFHVSPGIVDGTVYLTTIVPLPGALPPPAFQGSVLALDAATGQPQWENHVHGDGQGATPVVHDDRVIAGNLLPGRIGAYDRGTGGSVWHGGLDRVSAALVVTGDGYLIGGSQRGTLFIQDAVTGELVWQRQLSSSITGTPAYTGGQLVVAERNGTVHAFHLTGNVTGTVTGPDGPLPATVRLIGTDTQTTADPETGEFTLAGLAIGRYLLEVSHYGFGTTTMSVNVSAGRTAEVAVELALLDTGSLTGTVRDSAGQPLPGATVSLPDTPLEPVTTDADGRYEVPVVAEGQWRVLANAIGYQPHEQTVQIGAGATTEVDFTLGDYEIAVVSDFEHYLTDGLTERGWTVDRVTFDEIVGHLHRYEAVLLAGTTEDPADADLDRLVAIVDEADQVGTSLLILDQWSLAHGTLRPLAEATGDPAEVGRDLPQLIPVWLEDVVPHPITASLPVGERTVLLGGTVRAHAWFSGYSGMSLARLGTDAVGQRGDGIGYQPRGFGHNHILLPMHAPSPSARPDRGWEPVMWDILTDAVTHAATASYGAISGTVTDADGAPLAATVELVAGAGRTVADDNGEYQLFLPPGEHTVRFWLLGYQAVEVPVTITAGITHELNVTVPAAGLGTLTGQVTEDGTGRPLRDATVTVLDTGVPVASTDRDGGYLIEDIPGGVYDVEFAANGYATLVIEDVEITNGEVSFLDAALVSAPGVVVVGDSLGRVTAFLNDNDLPAEQAGWEVVDDLDGVEVVILHNPPNIGQEEFLAALAAFDAAGVSVIFPADGTATRTRGVDLLIRHTGSPPSQVALGSSGGPDIVLTDLAEHPIFDGLPEAPVPVLASGGRAAAFPSYRGQTLAMVGDDGAPAAGIGVAYDIRTMGSVHLLLSGLARTVFNEPTGNWTDAGRQLFLNSIRWAAAPDVGMVTGVVTDSGGAPIPHAVVEVAGAAWQTSTDADGEFALLVPAGEHTLRYGGFGYLTIEAPVRVDAGETVDAPATLALGDNGTISGRVTSDPGDGGGGSASLPDTTVRLLGTPRSTLTDENGQFSLVHVEPGSYELEFEAEGHLRTRVEVTVVAQQDTERDASIRVSPRVGVLGDFEGGAGAFLRDWGYEVVDIGWESTTEIAELDLVMVNLGQGSRLDPGVEGLDAFMEAVNRAGVSVLWLGQQNRGGIRELSDHYGDPVNHGGSFNRGAVTATVVEPHPLVAGLPAEFPLMANNGRFSHFDTFSGTTVATLSTGSDGPVGDTIAYQGRTTRAVDVLLSTLTTSSWGHPGTRDTPATGFTPEAEQVLRNALTWALDAEGLGAEVLGTVQSAAGGRIASQVHVHETGRNFTGRAGDGTFLVPLQPGTWTLTVSAFAHHPQTFQVTIGAGESQRPLITLDRLPAGGILGQVTDPDAAPLAGATVAVLGTDVTATTGPDGTYTIPDLPSGEWELEARADGHQHTRVPVTVVDGQVTTANIVALASRRVAVAGDVRDEITNLLRGDGYLVDQYLWHELDLIQAELEQYPLVILNGAPTSGQQPSPELFTGFLDAAAAADVSVIFASVQMQGSLVRLAQTFGDPGFIRSSFELAGPIYYTADEPHPLFTGVDTSEPVVIMTPLATNQQYMFYEDYSGVRIAGFEAPIRGESGDGAGYRFTSPSSVHLLLTNLMATPTATFSSVTGNWTEDGKRIYLNGVQWAIDATQAEVTGVVTGAGQPLSGARVRAVETDQSTLTGPDGSYALGLAGGTYTIEVTAFGFEPTQVLVEVPETGTVTLDVDLVSLPRGEVTGQVTGDGVPISGALLTASGPMPWQASTDAEGVYHAGNLLEGAYEVTVTAEGFKTETFPVTVVAGEVTVHDIALTPVDIGVLGDVSGALTEFLNQTDLAAVELPWQADLDLAGFDVVVINGGDPDQAVFEAVLAEADAEQVSLVFTGTWAVDRGGIRLLEQFTDRVVVGEQGFGDGPVQVTGFDPEHPLFAGLSGDPATLIVEGGYYSVLAEYAGQHLADLHVDRDGDGPVSGTAVGWDWRTAGSVEVLLSASAVTEAVGPGLGWTADGGQLLVDAIEWARVQVMAEPPLADLGAGLTPGG